MELTIFHLLSHDLPHFEPLIDIPELMTANNSFSPFLAASTTLLKSSSLYVAMLLL